MLGQSGGVFLYAAHLAHALASGAFPDLAALPEAREFYPAYLARLRDRAGEALFESVYRPTLALLAAARQPVTLRQLHRWGVPPGRLQFALFDLADFLRVHRQPAWHDGLEDDEHRENRYSIAHEAFIRYLREHEPRWWIDAHTTIARTALPPRARPGWTSKPKTSERPGSTTSASSSTTSRNPARRRIFSTCVTMKAMRVFVGKSETGHRNSSGS